jgi:hypothetical protein
MPRLAQLQTEVKSDASSSQFPQAQPTIYGRIVALTSWLPSRDPPLEFRDGYLQVYCDWCGDFHTHAWRMSDGIGVLRHRVAHCGDERSPYRITGYFIAPLPRGHVARPGVAIERENPLVRYRRLFGLPASRGGQQT